jgi:hypothetical protein
MDLELPPMLSLGLCWCCVSKQVNGKTSTLGAGALTTSVAMTLAKSLQECSLLVVKHNSAGDLFQSEEKPGVLSNIKVGPHEFCVSASLEADACLLPAMLLVHWRAQDSSVCLLHGIHAVPLPMPLLLLELHVHWNSIAFSLQKHHYTAHASSCAGCS